MRKFLDLHDKQILKTVINPVNGHMQILISYHTDKLMEIRIKGIKKFMLDNLECISLFFESGGGLDEGIIEDTENGKILSLSGIIDWNQEMYINTDWRVSIESEDISVEYYSTTEYKQEILMNQEKIDIDKFF